jgi:hypothetical protein
MRAAKSQERNRRQPSDSNNSCIISSILKKPNRSKLKHQRSVRFEDPDDSPVIEYNPEHNTLSVQQYHVSPNTSFTLNQSPSRSRFPGNSPVSSSRPSRSKAETRSYNENFVELSKVPTESQFPQEIMKNSKKLSVDCRSKNDLKVVINAKYSKEQKISEIKEVKELKIPLEPVETQESPEKALKKELKDRFTCTEQKDRLNESPIKIITVAKLSKGSESRVSPRAVPKTMKLGCRDETFYNKLNYYLNAKSSLSPSRVPSAGPEVRNPIKKTINLSVNRALDSPSNISQANPMVSNKSGKSVMASAKKSQVVKSSGMNVLN